MPLTKEKKEQILSDLKKEIKDSDIVVFANFHGLSTGLGQEVRTLMRQTDSKYFVSKKTLIKKALGEFDISGEMPSLEGEVALVFSKGDVASPLKNLSKFSKKNPQISLLGGVFENSFIGKGTVLQIAALPNKETLLAQYLNVINAPARGLVNSLSGVQRNFVNVLNEINKIKETRS